MTIRFYFRKVDYIVSFFLLPPVGLYSCQFCFQDLYIVLLVEELLMLLLRIFPLYRMSFVGMVEKSLCFLEDLICSNMN